MNLPTFLSRVTEKWSRCDFDKKYYRHLWRHMITVHPIMSEPYSPLTSRKREIIANYAQNRAYRGRNERSGKCCDVTYRAGVERIRMRRGFSKEVSMGDNDYTTAIPWRLRDISRRRPSVVESCILRRLLTGPTRPISFAGVGWSSPVSF